MARTLKSDTLLFSATLLLLVVSMAWVYSASAPRGGDVERQLLWAAFGVGCMLVTMRLDYRVYSQQTVLLSMVGAVVFGLVVVFFCPARNGAHRWVGSTSIGGQPSEFAKLVTIVFMSAALQEWFERREELRATAIRIGSVVGTFVVLIVVEPDFGSAAALTAIALTMVFVAGIAWKWVAGLALVAPPMAYAVLIFEPYRMRRLTAWLDPWGDRLGDGFQPVQSMIAVGTGGIWGKGFMQGVQKMFYLPEAHNDFIYAVIAEEQGLIGASLVLAFFCILVWRGLRAARRVPDAYGALLATGITAMLGLQALLNISVVLNLLPAKGIALPFVSAGGSSMVVSLTAMGILLNVSQHGTSD